MTTAPALRAAEAPPVQLATARRWLLWKAEQRVKRDGTLAVVKVPCYIDGTRRRGDLGADGARLVDYAQACAALAMWGGEMAGLAIALGAGWQGVDLDHVDQRPELAALVETLPSYVEWSPSGTGVHAIGFGAPFATLGSNKSGIEAYASGRFFTFTGRAIHQRPIADLTEVVSVLARAHAAARTVPTGQPIAPAVAVPAGDPVLEDLSSALRFLDADDRSTWIEVGECLYRLGDVGYRLWSEWSSTDRYPGGDDLERWNTFHGTRTGHQSIFNKAEAAGWRNPKRLDPAAIFAGSSFSANTITSEQTAPNTNEINHLTAGLISQQAGPTSTLATPPAPPVPVPRVDGQSFREADGQQRAATLENVADALAAGVRLGYDAFQDLIMLARAGEWQPITDNDYAELRLTLGRGGFKPVGPEIMRSAVGLVAERNRFDSAIDWAGGLHHDGVLRIDTAMSRYYGCADTPYARAVGAYLFTALAGRALVPGCQADMAVILIGVQGAGKTSSVAALCPQARAFGTVDLTKRDDDLARRLRGKLVVEWAELRGLTGRGQDDIKDWIVRREEEWIPKYREFATFFKRRCIVIGTGNGQEILDDPTGERRWLPLTTGRVDVEALARDRDQLWAEGVARFKQSGIAWRDAERLARAEHADYKVYDEWEELVINWLEQHPAPVFGQVPSPHKNKDLPFSLNKLALEALGIKAADLDMGKQKRLGKLLKSLKFYKKPARFNNTIGKLWFTLEGVNDQQG